MVFFYLPAYYPFGAYLAGLPNGIFTRQLNIFEGLGM
jgi:hypothetical protein